MTASPIAPGRVWRPYDDDPLVTPDMLAGLDACDSVARGRLLAYLGAVVAHRAAPVHTSVAFNAVYFGYDIEAGGYVGGPLDIGDFPSVALGDEVEALPVGAMINIRTGGDLLPAEVVYKEGAHTGIGLYGETPYWLSGAPSGARGPGLLAPDEAPALRERLVFDSTAFGQGLAPKAERLQRLRRQDRTDAFGHLVVDSRYARADADLSDADYYAHYLVARGRAQLTSALAPVALPLLLEPGSGDGELLAAVRGLMSTVRQALAALDEARTWGEYAFTRASMARRLADSGSLGRDDLVRLAESTARHGIPRERRRVGSAMPRPAYTALGVVLRAQPEWRERLWGTDYPLAVCHANSVLSDYARREHDEMTGLLPSGVRLSLDDRWQGGGVWRAELAAVGGRVGRALANAAVDEPAGLGWGESFPRQPSPQVPRSRVPVQAQTGPESQPEPQCQPRSADITAPEVGSTDSSAVAPEPAAEGNTQLPNECPGDPTPPDAPQAVEADAAAKEPEPAPRWPHDSELGFAVLLSADDSQTEWAQPLRLSHVLGEFLPLPEHVARQLASGGAALGRVRVVLHHAGQPLPPEESCHDARLIVGEHGSQLDGIPWPLDFFPGIWLSFTWQRGSSVIHARTALLQHPVTIDGDLISHRYDPQVLTRDGSAAARTAAECVEGLSPRQLLLVAVRRLGLLDRFGQAVLARTDVPDAVDAVMGGARIEAARIEAALAGLLADERLTLGRGSRGTDGATHHPPQSGEPLVDLVCYRPHRVDVRRPGGSTSPREPAPFGPKVLEHGVAGFLRRIGHLGHEATDEQRALYRADHRRFRLSGPAELPPGYTYVRPHKRGH
ncbi:hypothetical protein C7C46_04505 [Streptomyces tateyamensis]|uniref:Uncharacterized protein n=1 Tax=Streptomyces tateyamensis TaxID=565073 RepID=A0A2V4PMM1_9ACTN|nr:hypothetical protein [Streptomyces tateyamensis]PYC87441.1 hypothetical protein C7C46_04505 [Streptomyces tateyamensis]